MKHLACGYSPHYLRFHYYISLCAFWSLLLCETARLFAGQGPAFPSPSFQNLTNEQITIVQFCPDDTCFITAGKDGSMSLWRVPRMPLLLTFCSRRSPRAA